MISWVRFSTALVGALIISTVARADMMPPSAADVDVREQVCAVGEVEAQTTNSVAIFDRCGVADLEQNPIGPPQAPDDFGGLSLTQDAQILTDGQKSFHLCLSALIGLGLCSSAHCLKKVNFGFIPEWYHNGGPFQIGHSLAVTPDSICPAPVYCFIQPDHMAEDPMPISRLRDITSLWRQSQFTPDVIASRGPPIAC